MQTILQEAIHIYNSTIDDFSWPQHLAILQDSKICILNILEQTEDSTIVLQTLKLRSEIIDILRTNSYI